MLADLKARAARVDRKRVYTAAAALLVAGAAGHFMQLTSEGARGPAMMSASVPAISAPEILAAPQGSPAEAATLDNLPSDTPGAPMGQTGAATVSQSSTLAAVSADTSVASPERAAPQIVAAAPVSAPRPAPKPTTIPGTGAGSTAVISASEVDGTLQEVTRAASDPLLSITEPTPERDKENVFAAATDDLDMPPATAAAPAAPETAGCAVNVEGIAKPGAILEIEITAPCNSGEPVSFAHAGLKFSEQLGPDGSLTVEVPAMTGTATVSLGFGNGADRDIEVNVPDFDAFDRIAVIWQGATGLQLHALEAGARRGEAGHVWADTPGKLEAAIEGKGGFLSVLGSTSGGFSADVYTYPAALTRQGVEPDISIQAQVMENTCSGKIEGWILRTDPSRAPHVETLTIMVPGCDAVGEYLVLKNLPVELRLARR